MASISNSTVIFTGTSVSDHLRTSTNGVNGVPLRALGKSRLGTKTRDLTVKAKLKKVKKQEYPWPDNPDPNVKGGVLSHVSHFKPLKEKPKTITLDFEKQLVELEKKLTEVRKLEVETGMDFSDQIVSLENKYQQTMKNLYAHLTPIQRVNIARHPNRPTFLDHIFNITEKFVELHGDRAGYDDPAIVTGIGAINSRRYMFIGQQKGRNTKENIMRNFGMPTPHGYRKALRMMRYADHHGFPIVTFIDTPGAFADLKSEELGQGEAIAHNLREMFGLKVPVVSIVIGEGGSGGALAIGCANKLLMLENAVFYVASPEACAAILWKSAKASPKAAEKLKITAAELCKLQIADGIIPEPLGGAHTDPSWTSQQIKNAINEAMDELSLLDTKALLEHRNLKFRKIGGFQEGIPIHPDRKFKMKKKELPDAGKTPVVGVEDEVENMRQQISNARESSSGKRSETAMNEMIEKLKKEVGFEFSEAIKALGLQERISALRKEVLEARSNDQLITSVLMDKIENLQKQFDGNLSSAPNYESLRNKLDMLKELSRAKLISDKSSNDESVKLELSNKLKEVMNQSDMKEKIESLNAELQKLRTSGTEDIDQETKDRISKMKKDIDLQVANTLKGMGLEVEALPPKEKLLSKQLRGKVDSLNEEISKRIGDLINSSDIKTMIQRLKSEVALAGVAPEPATKVKIKALEDQIKQRLSVAISSTELEEKHEELKSEIFKALESEGNGSLKNDSFQCENSRVEVSLAANVSW